MCFVLFAQQTAVISVHDFERLVFVMEINLFPVTLKVNFEYYLHERRSNKKYRANTLELLRHVCISYFVLNSQYWGPVSVGSGPR